MLRFRRRDLPFSTRAREANTSSEHAYYFLLAISYFQNLNDFLNLWPLAISKLQNLYDV